MQHSNLDLRKIMVGHPSNPAEQEAYQRFSRYIWYVVIVMVGCTLASYAYLGISVNLEGAWWFPSVPPFFVGMAFFYGRIRPDQYLSRLMETTAQLFFILSSATLLTFAASHASRTIPLRDPWLHAADLYIGFDWIGYARFFNEKPIMENILRVCYPLIMPQFCLIGVVLTTADQIQRFQQFIFITALVLIVANGLFYFFQPHRHSPISNRI